jgi:hypothetical protein
MRKSRESLSACFCCNSQVFGGLHWVQETFMGHTTYIDWHSQGEFMLQLYNSPLVAKRILSGGIFICFQETIELKPLGPVLLICQQQQPTGADMNHMIR